MTIIEFFAKGGKTKDVDLIKGIQKLLGVDDIQMQELWQIGLNKYGSEEGIADALNKATQDLNETSSQEEIKNAIASVFSNGSEMFKCGGKMEYLLSKFGNGGSMDCGCNKKQEGGYIGFKSLPSRIFNEKGMLIGYNNNPTTIDYINSRKNDRVWTVQEPTLQSRINNTTNQSKMLWNPESLPETYGNTSAFLMTEDLENPGSKLTLTNLGIKPSVRRKTLVETGDQDYVKMQDGGGISLTRRQAKDLSKLNNNYNNQQFRTAMANAKQGLRNNTDLTGKDLRNQAKLMVSGLNLNNAKPTITSTPTTVALNVQTPILSAPSQPSTLLTREIQPGYDNMTFGNAFNAARQNGEKIFTWKGKKYNTNLAIPQTTITTPSTNQNVTDQRKYLQDIQARASVDPNWFWSDDASANAAREYLYKMGDKGNEFITDIYNTWTPEELQKTISIKKLPNAIQQNRYNQGITNAMNEAGKNVGKGAAVIAGTLAAAEAIPLIAEYGPSVLNTIRTAGSHVWNPAQAKVGNFFTKGLNGAIRNNATGQFVSGTGMNMGQFTSGTDLAGTIANNLRMWTPVGFKCGGKIKKKEKGGIASRLKCGGKKKK